MLYVTIKSSSRKTPLKHVIQVLCGTEKGIASILHNETCPA